jgi:predicted secreted protein
MTQLNRPRWHQHLAWHRAAAAATALAATLAQPLASAQTPSAVATAVPQNVLSLSATASVEVVRDWLSIVLSTTREAPEAAAVQAQLRQALDTALNEARRGARPGQVEVRTGGFNVSPRYGQKGQISGWAGSAELVIEGRDVAALSQLVGRLNTLTVARTGFSLSREAREKVEGEVAGQAIARFRAQAEAYARQFGFAGYGIREVQVNTGSDAPQPVMMARASMARAEMADAALPVEAGKATVTAQVSGSVQMSIK